MRRAEAGIQVDKFYPPTDWLDSNNKQIDIRKNAENNSIVLLVGHSADFSKYSLLGLLADTSSGTYDVYIDDVLVGSGITKNTQYDIDFSTINTSYGSATTPESLVLHKVVIKPTTSGANLTVFRCARTTGVSTTQQQGVMWCHFELTNEIQLEDCFSTPANYVWQNLNLLSITAKGDYINNTPFMKGFVAQSNKLTFVPRLKNVSSSVSFIYVANLKRIVCDNISISDTYVFSDTYKLEKINIKNNITVGILDGVFRNTRSLKLLPTKGTSYSNGNNFCTRNTLLYPTKIDYSDFSSMTKIGLYGDSTYPMRGLRGLKVSNEAPFSGSSPQINVSYTGLDRDALVELFNSLPTVTGSQILKCDHCTGTADLTDEDKAIATNKGWGLTLS